MKLQARYTLAPRAHEAAQAVLDEYLGNLPHREVLALTARQAKAGANQSGEVTLNGRVIGQIVVVEAPILDGGGSDGGYWTRKIAALPAEVEELKKHAMSVLREEIANLEALMKEFE